MITLPLPLPLPLVLLPPILLRGVTFSDTVRDRTLNMAILGVHAVLLAPLLVPPVKTALFNPVNGIPCGFQPAVCAKLGTMGWAPWVIMVTPP